MMQPVIHAHCGEQRDRFRVCCGDGRATNTQRQRDVLHRGEFGQQMMKLINKSERKIPQITTRSIGQSSQRLVKAPRIPVLGSTKLAWACALRGLPSRPVP